MNQQKSIQGKELKTILVLEYGEHYKKLHPYDVKNINRIRTSHNIHMVEGGKYLTENMEEFDPSGDMGAFQLNQKEYEYFKQHLKQVEFEKINGYWRERE